MAKVKFLYDTKIRTSKTIINDDNVIGLMNKGVELNLSDAQIGANHSSRINGVSISSNKWFSDKNGWFYWAGATNQYQVPPKPVVIQDVKPEGDYGGLLLEGQAEPSWWHNDTSAVKIAIIDNEFDLDHPNLNHLQGKPNVKVFDLRKIEDSNTIINAIPHTHKSIPTDREDFHGTTCLSILAARGKRVRGLLPNAKYYLIKVKSFNNVQLLKALEIVKANRIRVVSCSLNYYDPRPNLELATKIETLIDKLGDKTFLVMSLSNSSTKALTNFYYPMRQKKIVRSVALRTPFFKKKALSTQVQEIKNTSFAFRHISFCTLFSNKDSLNSYNYLESSFTAPIIAGLASKIMAKNKGIERAEIIKKIADISSSYDKIILTKDLKFYTDVEEENNQHLPI